MMSYVMPNFPSWLLYGTTIIYTLGFWIATVFHKENPFSKSNRTWAFQRYYLLLSIFTALNGLFFQFSAAWVSGTISQILANFSIIQIPFLEAFAFPSRRKEYKDPRQIIGLALVFIGILVGIVPVFKEGAQTSGDSEQSNKWYWIVLFILSTSFNALQQVFQDVAFNDKQAQEVDKQLTNTSNPGIKEISCLAWYNMYSLPLYLLVIPLEAVKIINGTTSGKSVDAAFENQENAFLCFFGHPKRVDILDGGCEHGATLWPLLFCIGYLGMFGTNALMIKRYGVLFPNILGATIQLLAAIVFSVPVIVGSKADKFSYWPILGCIIIIAGVITRQTRKKPQPKEEEYRTPLIQ